MEIGLIDVDGHNFPNLALMKISAYHKAQGDTVEWVNYLKRYDIVYMSKLFTFTQDVKTCIQADKIIKGGTGYNIHSKLPKQIETTQPDYSIYPKFKEAYGFITRGCVRKCPWCVVPEKEGDIYLCSTPQTILQDRKSAVFMDNNILASSFAIPILREIIEIGKPVDFNQGLDARLVTDDIADMLSKVKWIRHIRFSYDTNEQIKPLKNAVELLNKYGVPASKIFVYVLISDLSDSYDRIVACKNMKVNPFAQPYRDFTQYQKIPQWQKDMAHWCNKKSVFKSIDFKEFTPRKGFKCNEYFKTN